jgi:pimeloyl-ACP methyl ester carboxylesterase
MVGESVITTSAGPTRCLEAGSGWPVLLLHAFPLNADMWRPQLERAPGGWRLVAPDLRGFGPAAGAAPGGRTSIDDLAAGAKAVLDALEIDRAAIAGLSMGGYVAFALFRLAPDRFERLVLADTRSQADTPEGREGRAGLLDLLRRDGPAGVADAMLPKLLGETSQRDRPDVAALVRRLVESNPAGGLAGAIEAMMDRPDSTPDLARIACPALILVGGEDRLTPRADAESMQRQISRSRLVVLEGAGHLSSLETPDTFSQALADFLTSNL